MTPINRAAAAALKTEIKGRAEAGREHRALAAQHFIVARKRRREDNPGAEAMAARGQKHRLEALRIGDDARYLLLAYAWLRGRFYADLEGTRKWAHVPEVERVVGVLKDVGVVTIDETVIEAWLSPPAPRPQTAHQEAPAPAPAG